MHVFCDLKRCIFGDFINDQNENSTPKSNSCKDLLNDKCNTSSNIENSTSDDHCIVMIDKNDSCNDINNLDCDHKFISNTSHLLSVG